MVNFDNEATIGASAVDIVRILILQYRADTLEAVGSYIKSAYQTDPSPALLRSRLYLWFLEMEPGIIRRNKETSDYYKELSRKVLSEKFEDLLDAVKLLNTECDKINLIRIDNRTVYDTTRVETENSIKGL